MKIFLFAPMGAGKDTVADFLVDNYNFGSIALGGLMRKYILENNPSYVPKSNRGFEIEVAEQHKKWFGADYWARKSQPFIDQCLSNGDNVLIRDGRFKAEYDYYVNKQGFVPVKIVATEEIRKARIIQREGKIDEPKFYNPYDCEIINFHGVVLYNGTDSIEILRSEIRRVMDVLKTI